MAERRMFTQKITESDAFLEMPMSSQALYFHLCMNADDDGFVKNPKSIQRLVGSKEDDLKILVAKRFILPFDTGVIVIKHWRMHNLLRKDRYKETVYTDEKLMLYLKDDGAYTFDESQGKPIPKIGATASENQSENEEEKPVATKWQPNGNQMAPQDRLGKDSIDNNIPPYSAGACAHEGIDEALQAFCQRFNIEVDGYDGTLGDIDFGKLAERYERSKTFLQAKPLARSLKWICKNYSAILTGKYDDFEEKPADRKVTAHERGTDILKNVFNTIKQGEEE